MRKSIFLSALLLGTIANAQSEEFKFEKLSTTGISDYYHNSSAASGTINGKPAVLLLGEGAGSTDLYVFENGTFTKTNNSFQSLKAGDAAFVDIDNDGDLDIIISGEVSFLNNKSFVYRNDNGSFVQAQELVGVRSSSVDIGDYNNDSFQDVIINGYDTATRVQKSVLYKNNNGTLEESSASGLSPVYLSSGKQGDTKFIDFNNDGKLDILSIGSNGAGTNFYPVASVFIQQQDGNFTEEEITLGAQILGGNIAVADYNNDGYQDFFIVGLAKNTNPNGSDVVTPLLVTNTNGTNNGLEYTTLVPTVNVYSSGRRNVDFTDLNNDGKLDLVFSGANSYTGQYFVNIFKGTDNGLEKVRVDNLYTEDYGESGSMVVADFNGDNKKDILFTENSGNLVVFLNDSTLSVSDVATNQKTSVRVYPNPVSSEFSIKGESVVSATLYDTTGKVVKVWSNASATYNVESLPKGIYILKVNTKNGAFSSKLIKK